MCRRSRTGDAGAGWHQLAANVEIGRPAIAHRVQRWQFDTFLDGGQRDRIAFAAHIDQHAVDDGQRQRQAQGQGGSVTRFGVEIDFAPQRRDGAQHDIHADAATRQFGDLVHGRETGLEDHPVDLAVAELVLLGHQPLANRLLADLLGIQAAPVVAHGDQNLGPGIAGAKLDCAGFRFSGSAPVFRGFQAVIHRIAQDMHQRIGQKLDHGFVQLGVFAGRHEVERLVQ